jgi:hypothetical protein
MPMGDRWGSVDDERRVNKIGGGDDMFRTSLFAELFSSRLLQPYPGATAVLVDELDARQLKCPSVHIDRLRPHAKPVAVLTLTDIL